MMKKNNTVYELIRYNLTILLLFMVSFYVHAQIMIKSELQVHFSILNVYLFFAVSSSIIVSSVVLLKKTLPNQLGYLFLMAIFLKLGVFLLAFSNVIFIDEPLSMHAKLSIVAPLFIFLIYEGAILINLLKYIFKDVE